MKGWCKKEALTDFTNGSLSKKKGLVGPLSRHSSLLDLPRPLAFSTDTVPSHPGQGQAGLQCSLACPTWRDHAGAPQRGCPACDISGPTFSFLQTNNRNAGIRTQKPPTVLSCVKYCVLGSVSSITGRLRISAWLTINVFTPLILLLSPKSHSHQSM